MSFTTSMAFAGPFPYSPAAAGVGEAQWGSGLFDLQNVLAIHDYQGSIQAGLYRRTTFGWEAFVPQPTWRTNSQARAVWGYGNGEIVVHDSISAERFMHYDGSAWSNVTGFRGGVWVCEAIGGFSPSQLWAGGAGYVGSYDGDSWTEVLGYLAELDPVYGIWVKNENEVWVVGGSAGNEGVYRYLAGTWTNLYSAIEAVDSDIGVPMAVWGEYFDSDVWVVFDLCTNPSVSGRFARFNGDAWSIEGGAIAEGQQVAWGLDLAADKLWIAGDDSAGASPIISGWDGSAWDDKLTGSYVARRMLGLRIGLEAGVYLATGTAGSQNGEIYRRWDRTGIDDEHEWLNDQAPLRQWRDLAIMETPPPDQDPPIITLVTPYNGETDVEKNSSITFTVTDDRSDIDLSAVKAWVRGNLVFKWGWTDPNWTVSMLAIANGYQVTMTPHRLSYYRDEEVVGVRAYAEDTSANSADEAWTFTAAKSHTLRIYPMLFDGTRKIDEAS